MTGPNLIQDDKSSRLLCGLFGVCIVYCVHCMLCALYDVCTVCCVYCVLCALYALCDVYGATEVILS